LQFFLVKKVFFGLLVSFISSFAYAITVVVTIAPLASAIKPLLSENDKIIVLLNNNQSPHHFSLKPSHLLNIAKADFILSVGLGIDDWAKKAIINSQVKHLVFSSLDGVLLRNTLHESDVKHHHKHYDPHLWLDIDNIKVLVKSFSKLAYIDNNKKNMWLKKLTLTDKEIARQLNNVKNVAFLVQHAGFQYFNEKYSLNRQGSIQINDAGVSLKKILQLRGLIVEKNISCIFKSVQSPKKQITAIVNDLEQEVKIISLNGLGDKKLTSVQNLEKLMANYEQCLQY